MVRKGFKGLFLFKKVSFQKKEATNFLPLDESGEFFTTSWMEEDMGFMGMKSFIILLVILLMTGSFTACDLENMVPAIYQVGGSILKEGEPLSGVSLLVKGQRIRDSIIYTDSQGQWEATGLMGLVTVEPSHPIYHFDPARREVTVVDKGRRDLDFTAHLITYSLELLTSPGGAGVVTGAGPYPPGSFVPITLLPSSWEYSFVNWVSQEEIVSTEPIFGFTMPSEDVTLVAHFMENRQKGIKGYVTHTKGGPPVKGASITTPFGSTFTNEEGFFHFHLSETLYHPFQLLVEKEGYASAQIQDLSFESGSLFPLTIPIREAFHPHWPKTPPHITLQGVTPYERVEKDLTFQLKVTGSHPIYVIFVYFSGLQRSPRDGFFLDFQDTGEGEVTIDTTLYPDGMNFILVEAYDTNGNLAMKILPLEVSNHNQNREVPGELESLVAYAVTFGKNVGFYSLEERRDFQRKDIPFQSTLLQELPKERSLYVYLEWEEVKGADGYRVYRTFDGRNYHLISTTPKKSLYDFSPLLQEEKEIKYYVAPYNCSGEGPGLSRWLVPLAPFNVTLKEPGNNATNVPLKPTFKWENHESFFLHTPYEEWREYISYEYYFHLFHATGWQIDRKKIKEKTSYPYPSQLNQGSIYLWDIYDADAFIAYEYDDKGFSFAMSIAGDLTGSLHGENIFTTKGEDSP